MLRAVLWDVDGTLAETECDGHRVAFNQAFEQAGLRWRWNEARYGELLAVTGGRERLLHDMQYQPDAPASPEAREALAARLHRAKNALYADLVAQRGIPLREGVRELLEDCWRDGVATAIVTTTSRDNVHALLASQLGDGWRMRFPVLVCGEDVQRKKPDPQAYRLALDALRLRPGQALAIEDSPAGVQAALGAGVGAVVARSRYFAKAPASGALAAGASLARAQGWRPAVDRDEAARIDLRCLRAWHRKATTLEA